MSQLPQNKKTVLRDYEFQQVPEDEVDYEFPSQSRLSGTHVNTIPLQSTVAAPRIFYGAKFVTQAAPLVSREQALVQNLDVEDGEKSFDEEYGEKYAGAIKADADAEITNVTSDAIDYTDLATGEQKQKQLHNNMPFNRFTWLHQTPKVASGDRVKKGQLMATSNYTDDNGVLSLGANAKIGVVPYKGFSYEDATVVSDKFANRMTSEHLSKYKADTEDVKTDKNHFKTFFPSAFNNEQLNKVDDEGVVQKNTILKQGDPVILGSKPVQITKEDRATGDISKLLKKSRTNAAQIWDHEEDGEVVDVAKTKNGYKVNVKYRTPLKNGDKLSLGRAGQKAIVSKIIPDEEMPTTENGEPLEVLMNPLAYPSRQNASGLLELALGKIAKKQGKPIKLPSFSENSSYIKEVKKMLAENGLSDKEKVYDPVADKELEHPVTVGDGYVNKLHHVVDKKLGFRGEGSYDSDEQPAKSETSDKGKRLSGLETHSLLSAGAYNVIKDATTVRGARNDEYWREIREGGNPKAPKKNPFIWDKFNALVVGSGMDAKHINDGNQMRVGPMTDEKLEQKKPVEIQKPELLDNKNLNPVDGGLLDKNMAFLNKWGKISLDFPVVNPAFEDVVTKFTGLNKKQLEKVMTGEQELKDGGTGPEALKNELANLDLDEIEQKAKDIVKSGPKTKKPNAIKQLNYIKGLRRNELEPADLMIEEIPVIPAKFRQPVTMGDSVIMGDENELYRDTMLVRDSHRKLKEAIGEEGAAENRANVIQSVKALYGYDTPANKKLQQKNVSGFAKKLLGESPKYSVMQRKMLSKPQDFTGRSTVTTDPSLSINQVGLPEEMAWEIYKPYVQRRFVRAGMRKGDAAVEVQNRTPSAKQHLLNEMKERPVMYSRAPAWHKYNTIGGYPSLVDDNSIHANPLISSGMNLDHDGDDQINKVLILIDLHKNFGFVKKNPYSIFTTHDNKGNLLPTFKKLHIPTFNPKNYALAAVDLEDFPYGEFSNTVDGQNGPIHFYHAAPGTKVIAYNEETNKPEWADVSYYSVHPDREVEVVTLSNRKQIITDDDPRAIYGVDAAKGFTLERFTPSDALKKKVAVPVVKNIESLTNNGSLTEIEITDNEECPFQKLSLDFDFGYFCGAMAGDGWWDKKDYTTYKLHSPRSLYLADLKGHVANALEPWLKENIAQSGKFYSNVHKDYKSSDPSRYGDSVKYRWNFPHSTELTLWLSKHFGGAGDDKTAGSGNKRLPDFLCNAAKSYRAGVFCGLIDTDGTVSITHGKEKPQLKVNFASTSLRLIRDIQMLASSIGVRSAINYSKTTSRGNDCWVLNIKSGDIKNTGVLDKIVTPSKKEALEQGVVTDQTGAAIVDNKVVFPEIIKEKLSPYIICPKIRPEERENADSFKKWLQNVYQQWYAARNDSTISKPSAGKILGMVSYRVEQSVEDWSAARKKLLSMSRHSSAEVTSDEIDIIRKGIRASAPSFGDSAVKEQGRKLQSRTNKPKNTGILPAKIINDILEFLDNNTPHNPLLDSEIKTWETLINNDDVVWSTVEEVEKTGKAETGYDLTVPGRETFVSLDGIVLSNTINVHVPALNEAVDDVKNKLMPDKMLHSVRDFESIVPSLKQDFQIGLYSSARKNSKNNHRFATADDALQAIKTGKVSLSDDIEIANI